MKQRRARTGALSQALYALTMAVLRGGLLSYWQPRLSGREHLPADGSLIVAVNHATSLDPFLLSPLLPRRLDFLMAPEVRAIPAVGLWLREMGAIPLGAGCAEEALERLREGRWVGIFPEGRPTHTDELAAFQRGVFVLARRSRAPVLPVAIVGTHRLMPARAPFVEGGPVEVRLGAPLHWQGESEADFLARLRAAIDTLMRHDGPRPWRPDGRFRLARWLWVPITRMLFAALDRVKPGNFR